MQTIVQDYGPIYGEVVNGTVQGRPNGSIFVPISNTLSITLAASATVTVNSANLFDLSRLMNYVAQAQDLASNVFIGLYSDSACTTLLGTGRNQAAGNFNGSVGNLSSAGTDTITPGTTYYIRAQLMNNGSAVATSNVVTVVGA